MKKTTLIVGGVLILAIGFWVGGLHNQAKDQIDGPVGSVDTGSSYAWTSTSTGASTQQIITDNPVVLGSVVISTDSAGTFVVTNATSTDDTGETVASFEATATEGTYTYDVYMDKGLQITTGASGDGLITVTYRQQ